MPWNQSPEALEQWYRSAPRDFRESFERQPMAEPQRAVWAARLAADEQLPANNTGFPWAIACSIGIAAIILTPYWASGDMDPQWAVPLFATLALFPLVLFHGWRQWPLVAGTAVAAAVVAALWWAWEDLPSGWLVSNIAEERPEQEALGERINLLRQVRDLMMIHWPMVLVGVTGWAYTRSRPREQRVDYVRQVLVVGILTALVLAAGGLLLGLTNLLMEAVNAPNSWQEAVNIHLVVWGLSGGLVFGHAVWLRHPGALDRVLPTLARVFIPLFVLLEGGFLIANLADGFAALASDREQLFVFNLLLAAVIGLALLHSAFEEDAPRWSRWLMVALVGLGVVADAVGLAAIVSRLSEWGATPNRLTVLGGNLLFLATLVALLVQWFRPGMGSHFVATRSVLNRALAAFFMWAVVVTFGFTLAYGLRVNRAEIAQFGVLVEEAL